MKFIPKMPTIKKMKKSNPINKAICFTLLISMLGSVMPCVYAAPPAVTVDEAVYINTDYYGAFTDVSIVKGCSMNGITMFDDFGDYEKVSNMSNYAEPEYIDGGIRWDFKDSSVKRFYFECVPKEKNIPLPWSFDISYTLNGQPAFADKLAGAAGLVEIEIKAMPNENAPKYYRDNMLLTVTTMVDMEEVNAIEAEGAQLQSAGTYKAVAFAGLPGEECTFKLSIGTDSFENPGMVIAMVPGTLDQMSMIKDLKESKETLEDAADAIYDSLDKVLGTLSDMSGGLENSITALRGLDTFRADIDSQKVKVYENADSSLASLEEIIPLLNEIAPHIENGQNMVNDVTDGVNTIVADLEDFKSNVNKARVTFINLKTNTSKLRNALTDIHALSEQRNEIIEQLQKDSEGLKTNLTELKKSSGKLADSAKYLKRTLMDVEEEIDKIRAIPHADFSFLHPQNVLGGMIGGGSDEDDEVEQSNPLVGILPYYNAYDKVITGAVNSQIDALNPIFEKTVGYTKDVLNDTEYLLNYTDEMLDDVSAMCGTASHSIDALNEALVLSEEYFKVVDNNYENRDSALKTAMAALDNADDMMLKAYAMIDDTSELNNVINRYSERVSELMGLSAQLVQKMSTASDNTLMFARSLKSLLEDNGTTLNSAAQVGLNGLIDVLERAVSSIKDSRTIRNANDTIKKTVDDEIDDLEEDTKLLDLDSEAERISFTSDKNPAPSSIQVIIRTQEISIDDTAEKADLENENDDIGPWRRIAAIFVKLWKAVTGVFSEGV